MKKKVNFENFGDDDVDLDDVGRREESVRASRRPLALGQHAGVAAFSQVGQLVADLRSRPVGRRRCRVRPVGRQADTSEVDEREIDALAAVDAQSPRAVGRASPGLRRDAA